MNKIKTPLSLEPGPSANPIGVESNSVIKRNKKKIYLWAILWAIFPPVVIFILLVAILRPAIRGKEPNGINYIFWILGLIFWGAILELPLGSISTISEALGKPDVCRTLLFADGFVTIFSLLIIVLTFRKKKLPH